MPAIRFRTCTIEGSRADAVLAFREAVAASVQGVQDEISLLNDVPADRRNDEITLTGQDAVTLQKSPVTRPVFDTATMQTVQTDLPILTSAPDQQGTTFREAPRFNRFGGLVDTVEAAAGQWTLRPVDRTTGLTDPGGPVGYDAGTFGKHATLTGTALAGSAGPLGVAHRLDPGSFLKVPTGQTAMDISMSGLDCRREMAVWGWVKLDDNTNEHVLASYSSNPADYHAGTVTVTHGSAAVTGTLTNFSTLRVGDKLRLILSGAPGLVEYAILSVTNDRLMTLTAPVTLAGPGTTTCEYAHVSLTGTVTVAYGNNLVVGAGTNFSNALQDYNRVVLPDGRTYEVTNIAGVNLTVSPSYLGPNQAGATIRHGSPFQPKHRNTLYRLSTSATGKLVYTCQHHQRQDLVVTSNLAVPADEFFFGAFQRRYKELTGKVTGIVNAAGTTTVTGLGTLFTSELQAGWWIQMDGVDGWWPISSITSDTQLRIDNPDLVGASGDVKIFETPFSGLSSVRTTRTTLHVGLLNGTFTTETQDGLPFPDGGTEPAELDPVLGTRNALGSFYLGRDASNPAIGLGELDTLSLFVKNLDTDATANQVIYHHYSRAFSDFERPTVNSIARTVVSDIPDGATVYANYRYKTGVQDSTATTDSLNGSTSGLIGMMGNTNANSLSSLAQSTGSADPNATATRDLEIELARYGLRVANGRVLCRGNTDMIAYTELARTVGGSVAANALIAGKPSGSFVLVAITEDLHEEQTIDACGNPSTRIVVVERVVGVNRNVVEAAFAAGFTDASTLRFKLWWLGRVGNDNGTVARLKWLGLKGQQIALALALQSDDRFTTYLIPNQDAGQVIVGSGIVPADLDVMISDGILAVDPNPDTNTIARNLQNASVTPPGTTADGDARPDDPALLIAVAVDLSSVLKLEEAIEEVGAVFESVETDPDCAALAAVLEDMIRNVERTLKRVTAAIGTFTIKQRRSFGNTKYSHQRYLPCLGNVSATFALPPFHLELTRSIKLLDLTREINEQVNKQVVRVVSRFQDMLCIPRTFLAAIRGGVCGIEQPKVIASRSCPTQLDLLIGRLQDLLDTIDLLLRRILQALTTIEVDLDLSIGAASSLEADFSIPCIGPVSTFLNKLR